MKNLVSADSKTVARYDSSGQQAFWRVEPANSEVKAELIWIHGLCEHSYRFFGFADFLARAGIRVFLFHLQGHGLTPEQEQEYEQIAIAYRNFETLECLAERLSNLAESQLGQVLSNQPDCKKQTAMAQHVQQVRSMLPVLSAGLPRFIGGHSLGGLIACEGGAVFEEVAQWSGVLLSSPALMPIAPPRASVVERWILAASWSVRRARWLGPFADLPQIAAWAPISIDVSWVNNVFSDLEEEQRVHRADPLIARKVPLSYLTSIQQQMAKTLDRAAGYPVPLHIFIAEQDSVVAAAGVELFIENLASGRGGDCFTICKQCSAHDLSHSSVGSVHDKSILQWMLERIV